MISAATGQFLAGRYRGAGSYSDPTLVARTVAFTLGGGNLRTFIQLPMVCGVYALAGRNAALTPIWESGTFAFSGRASGFSIGVPAGSNAFALTGNSAVLLRSSVGNLNATVGSFGLTGRDLANAIGAPAGSGTFALTGNALGEGFGFPASSGVFVLTGRSASYSVGMPAGAGSFAITGNVAATNIGHILAAGSGTFALTGRAATTIHIDNLAAGSGTFALTGNDAGLGGAPVWNSSDKAAAISLSGGGLVATNSGSPAHALVRSTRGRTDTTGRYFFTLSIGNLSSNIAIGFANATESLSNYLGNDSNGVGYFNDTYIGNGSTTQSQVASLAFNGGDLIAAEWIPALSQVKFYKWVSGAWSLVWTADNVSLGTTIFATAEVKGSGDSVTANFGASAMTLPSGTTSWDGSQTG